MKKNAYTQEEFINKVKLINPTIEIISEYTGVANKIEIKCKHSDSREIYAWGLLKKKHCCPKGYHEQRIPGSIIDIEQRKTELKQIFNNEIDIRNALYNVSRYKISGLICIKHNIEFSQWINSLKQGIGCPQCGKEKKRIAGINSLVYAREVAAKVGKAVYISNSETKWLDSLAIPVRQYWLPDVKYRVDGFDPATNTVYLFHGRFWHGCPKTYDPEYVHPIVKLKMKQLYEQTVEWEQKIVTAGYNLIIEWD